MSGATSCAGTAKYGGLGVSDTKRLRALESENGKLKDLLSKKVAAPGAPRTSSVMIFLMHKLPGGL